MEKLLEQVPELKKKLRKRSEIRTTHFKDVYDNPSAITGEVVTFEWWVDDLGNQWTRSDVLHYIKVQEMIDAQKTAQAIDKEVEYAN